MFFSTDEIQMIYIRLRRSNHHYLFMKQIKCQIWRRIVHQQISEHCVVANMCFDLLTKNHKLSLVSLAVWLTLVKPIMDRFFHLFIMIIFDSVLCIAFHHSECIVFFCGNIGPKLIAGLLRCDVLVIALSVFCESSRLTTWHFGANLGPLSVSSSSVIVCVSTILWAMIAFTGNEIDFGHPDLIKKYFYEKLAQ